MLLMVLSLTQVGQQNEGLVFGLNTTAAPIDRIQDFTPPMGGVTFFKEECYLSSPYEGLYLWSKHDQRMNELASILGSNGVLHLVYVYTPRWVSGWYQSYMILEGEINQRPVGWPEYYNHVDWYANNYEALVRRYGPGGIVPLSGGYSIRSWGLWTEPDGGSLMMGVQEINDNPASWLGFQAYHDIASLAAERIKELDPGAEVIAGGFLSPMSGRTPDQYAAWQNHARKSLQLIFGNTYNVPGGPVIFSWNEPPDALDWHPYDYMILDDCAFDPVDDWYYDPLVLDNPEQYPSDLMYRFRLDELPEKLDEWFYGSLEPEDWDLLPQKLLEFCPTYHLSTWRDEERLPTADEFYTKWRANYFITSLLMMSESQHMHTFGPSFPAGGWWVEEYPPFTTYSNIVNEEYPSVCDLAYLYYTSTLTGYHCETWEELTPSLLSAMNLEYSVKVTHWIFEDSTEPGPSIHALRTSRVLPNEDFDPELLFEVQFNVKPFVSSIELYDIVGEALGTFIPSQGTITVPITGYVRYAIEDFGNSNSPSVEFASLVAFHNHSESFVEFISNGITRLNIYDLSGRLVEELCNSEAEQENCVMFTWGYGNDNIPAGCYFAAGFNGIDGPLALEKVVIW